MWHGVIPAVTSKFNKDGTLDIPEMQRCFGLLMEADCDGLIVGGSLGEGAMMTPDERLQVLSIARDAAGEKPVLMTINEPSTWSACATAERAAKAGADGLMVVPSPIYQPTRRFGDDTRRCHWQDI